MFTIRKRYGEGMRTSVRRKFAVLSMLGVLLLSMTLQAMAYENNVVPAYDSDAKSTLDIKFIYHDGKDVSIPVEGAEFTIYKVASLNVKYNNATYKTTEEFSSVDVDYDDMTIEESNEAAAKLHKLAEDNKISGASATTGSDGIAGFQNLEPGMYLVVETGRSGQALRYNSVDPYLVMAPGIEVQSDGSNVWVSNVTTEPKSVIERRGNDNVDATITVNKELSGKDLEKDMFTFDLNESDEEWSVGEVIETAKNTASGKVNFTLSYDNPGIYYYTITEEETDLEYITTDNLKVRVKVEVEIGEDGNLTVTNIQMSKDSTFNNSYDPPSGFVKTGDDTNIAIWIVILIVAAVIVIAVFWKRKRNSR